MSGKGGEKPKVFHEGCSWLTANLLYIMEKRHGPRPTETVAAGLLFSAAGDGADVRPSCKNNGGRIKFLFFFFGG